MTDRERTKQSFCRVSLFILLQKDDAVWNFELGAEAAFVFLPELMPNVD